MPSALFVHNGWPGRFAPVADALMARGWECALINGPVGTDLKGAKTAKWSLTEPLNSQNPLTRKTEGDIAQGYAAATAAAQLHEGGFRPDVIIGHPGWGEMLFLKEVLPQVPQIQVGEFFYHSTGADVGFDTEFETPSTLASRSRIRARNLGLSQSYLDAARIVCPTPFQASLLPPQFQPRVSVIHEGIDVANAHYIEGVQLQLPNGAMIKRGDPVVTFVNRYFEPMRGFHVFMRALPEFLARSPDAQVVMIGVEDLRGYGSRPPNGETWKQVLLRELDGRLDLSRIHFVGAVPYPQLIKAFSISAAHVYFTYPFVLSWSLLDAMASEALIVASNTAPVRDVVRHGENGLLVDFFDREGLAACLTEACANPGAYTAIRKAARATVVDQYDREKETRKWLALIDEVVAGH